MVGGAVPEGNPETFVGCYEIVPRALALCMIKDTIIIFFVRISRVMGSTCVDIYVFVYTKKEQLLFRHLKLQTIHT